MPPNSGEEKPSCLNCQRQGEVCDYSIRLNWDGRSKKKGEGSAPGTQSMSFDSSSSGFRQGSAQGQYSFPTDLTSMEEQDELYVAEGSSSAHGGDRLHSSLSEYGSPQPSMTAMSPVPWPDLTSVHQVESQQLPGGFSMMHGVRQSQPFSHMPSSEPYTGSAMPEARMEGSMRMPPPYATSSSLYAGQVQSVSSPSNSAKRVRLSHFPESFGTSPHSRTQSSSSYGPGELDEAQRPASQILTPTLMALNNPMTSATSSITSEDLRARWASKSMGPPGSPADLRRVSVNSLLSNSPESEESPPKSRTGSSRGPRRPREDILSESRRTQSDPYGYDRGQPDLDVPRNNDSTAISMVTPSDPGSDVDSWLQGFDAIPEFAFGLQKRERVFAKGGYYAQTVPIQIPQSLEPLPDTLKQNPMNLLYFHHFLNHTARILVPHDCSENPFKTILPKSKYSSMATFQRH